MKFLRLPTYSMRISFGIVVGSWEFRYHYGFIGFLERSDDPRNPAQKKKNGIAAVQQQRLSPFHTPYIHRSRCSHLGHLIDQSSALSPSALLLRLPRLLPANLRLQPRLFLRRRFSCGCSDSCPPYSDR